MSHRKLTDLWVAPALEATLLGLCRAGRTIEAIGNLRLSTGCNLGEAKAWMTAHPLLSGPDIQNPNVPCPYCGRLLRTDQARQCFECGMDWHDPARAVKHRVTQARPTRQNQMTEAEWLSCDDLQRILELMRPRASERKLRLLVCAFCRRVWDRLVEHESRSALEILEHEIDRPLTDRRLGLAQDGARNALERTRGDASEQRWYYAHEYAADAVNRACNDDIGIHTVISVHYLVVRARAFTEEGAEVLSARSEKAAHADFLRDILGNPFRPVSAEQRLVTSTVRAVAEHIYHEGDFDQMPVLGDCLEEAGCSDQTILSHCRRSGPHARGCFVVDLVLGKE